MSSPDMLQQADSVWRMLNDLADTDPEGYKKFIDKTMKEGSQQFKPPQPCFCVSTTLVSVCSDGCQGGRPWLSTGNIYIVEGFSDNLG